MTRWKAVLSLGIVALLASTIWSGLGTMSVQVREGQLRANPSFLGAVVGSVSYGERVDVLQQQGDWMEVIAGGRKGWIHGSALTSKAVSFGAGGKDAELKASGREVALAGKGFNAEVEAQYRKGRQDVNFPAVDRMESVRIAPEELLTFVRQGDLKAAGGGGK